MIALPIFLFTSLFKSKNWVNYSLTMILSKTQKNSLPLLALILLLQRTQMMVMMMMRRTETTEQTVMRMMRSCLEIVWGNILPALWTKTTSARQAFSSNRDSLYVSLSQSSQHPVNIRQEMLVSFNSWDFLGQTYFLWHTTRQFSALCAFLYIVCRFVHSMHIVVQYLDLYTLI